MAAIMQIATVVSQAIRDSGTGVGHDTRVTSAGLSPDLALAYVRELSADVRAGVVLSAAGERLAGDEALGAPARALLAAADAGAPDIAVRTASGVVIAARAQGGAAIVVACGPHAIEAVTALDARTAIDAMDSPSTTDSATLSHGDRQGPNDVRAAAEAVISATQLGL
jgi:hypothetical protein